VSREIMSINVFISYPAKYENEAGALADCLGRVGISCYSFLHIPPCPGIDFPAEIRANIQLAHFLVVLWGKNAAESDWVRDEFQYANILGKIIIPVLIDNSPLPINLQHKQAVLAFNNPNGWILQVTDAIVAIVNFNYQQQQQIDYQNQQVQQKQQQERKNFLNNLVTGVLGIGVLLAIAAATSNEA
jgi:phosphoglycerate dehydrogenase-like enzyme